MGSVQGGPIDILHVDDDQSFADLCHTFLERERELFDVEIAHDANAARTRLEEAAFDCVVSDYDIPGETGIDLLQAVREIDPNLPFILFTGKGSEEIASEAISVGVTDYLQKGGGTEQYAVLANRIANAVAHYRAERLVRRSFRAMDRAREGMALLDEGGRFIYVNDAYTDLVGYDRETLLGARWETVYPDDQVERIVEEILPRVPEEGSWTGNTVYERADGERILVNHALAYSDENTMICLIRDISDADLLRNTRRQERDLLDLLIDSLTAYAIVLTDPDGYVTGWNQGAEAITGYGADEILGRHPSVFYAEAEDAETLLDAGRSTGRAHQSGWRERADGHRFYADETLAALRTEGGVLRGFALIFQDITDRREREEALRAAQAQFDALADLFYVIDPDRGFVRYNDRLPEVTGYDCDALDAMDVLELIPEGDREQFEAEHERLLETDEIVSTRSAIVTADDSRIPYEFRRRRLVDDSGRVVGFAGIGRDITIRKEYERRLEQELTRLDEFASVLSHDLRNPLAVAKGYLPALEEDPDPQAYEKVRQSLERIEEIIEDVLVMTRSEHPDVSETSTDLVALARQVWEDMEKGAVDPEIDVEPFPPIRADPSLLERLLMNLFRNAIEHGDTGVTVSVGTVPGGFYVEDDGPGIPAEDRERVFDWKFTTKASGTGVGLRSVQQIVAAHGWSIDLGERPGGGARFEITGIEFVPDDPSE